MSYRCEKCGIVCVGPDTLTMMCEPCSADAFRFKGTSPTRCTKKKDNWVILVDLSRKRVDVEFCGESMGVLFLSEKTLIEAKSDIDKYTVKLLDRALKGDFSL